MGRRLTFGAAQFQALDIFGGGAGATTIFWDDFRLEKLE